MGRREVDRARMVITGDITTVTIDVRPTVTVGNSVRFETALIERILHRSQRWLSPNGMVMFVLPVSFFQYA